MGVYFLDQMSRCYSVKAGSRRWPIHVFYNVIDMALVNSRIIYKHVCNSSINRRMFIQRISEELTGAVQTKGYKLKSMQLLQSVLQHLKNEKLVPAKTPETEQQIFTPFATKLYVVNVRLNNVKLAPHENMYFPLVCLSFNSCLFCFVWFFRNIIQFVIFYLN